jgi:RNA polymerase sigma factor (sigma-70 family)
MSEELNPLHSGDSRVAAPAWESLDRGHTPALLAVALRIVGCPHLAADVVQKVYLQYFQRFRQPNGHIENEGAWLARCVHNEAINVKRQRRKTSVGAAAPLPAGDMLADGQPSPSSVVGRAERNESLRAAIAQLPDDMREIVQLRYFEQLPTLEIASRLGITDVKVRVTLRRARLKLRELLGGSSSGR